MRNLKVRSLMWLAPALLLAAGCGPGDEEKDACENVRCGLNATCSDGACACDSGFAGNPQVACQALGECAGVSCGENASCSAGACKCNAGFEGDADAGCTAPVVCTATSCNGNGTCEVKNGAVACECSAGYTGPKCSQCATGFTKVGSKCVANDLCDAVECTENGSCVVDAGTASCDCAEGWAGDVCDGCAEGYALIGTECVNKTMTVSCRNDSPANANTTVVDVEVTYDEETHEWSAPAACEWECKTDYFEDERTCINSRKVACDSTGTPPDHAEYESLALVDITYTTAGGWTDASACPWTCKDGFLASGGACVLEPTLASCRLVTETVDGISGESYPVVGEVEVSDGDVALVVGEVCYSNEHARPVCVRATYDSGVEFVADVTFPSGTYDYSYRFSSNGGRTWMDCDADPAGVATITASPSEQLESVRAASGAVDIDVKNVFVTVVVPDAGDDVTRFFVQATATGPAVYVEVASTQAQPSVGDKVSFTVKSVGASSGGVVTATDVADFDVLTEDNDLSGFIQDLSQATDVVSGLDAYESEIVELNGVLTSKFVQVDDFWVAGFQTVQGEALELRMPDALFATAPDEALDTFDVAVENGCEWSVRALMWRDGATPQPTLYDQETGMLMPSDFACIQFFAVRGAASTGNTEVTVTFNVEVNEASLVVTNFVFDPPLAVTGVELGDDTNTVVLTTASQSGNAYEVTVSGVTDTDGRGLRSNRTKATFGGICDSTNPIVISQVYGAGGNSGATYNRDFIELFNRSESEVNLAGWSVQYTSAAGSGNWSLTPLTGTIPANGFYLVGGAGGANGVALPTVNEDGSLNMAAPAGKVALVMSTTQLTGACPDDALIVDVVGFGATATCFAGAGPTPAPSASKSVVRVAACEPSVSNNTDFVSVLVAPRNSSVVEAQLCANICEPD